MTYLTLLLIPLILFTAAVVLQKALQCLLNRDEKWYAFPLWITIFTTVVMTTIITVGELLSSLSLPA